MREKKVEESKTIMTEMIMPNDTNPLGNLMGGNLMRWMDFAGGICAGKHCEAYVVTASVDHVSFQQPIKLGNVISLNAKITRAFNTSVEVYIEVYVSDITGANTVKSNHAYMTFVALDANTMKPRKVPSILPITPEEHKLFESAVRRRELRLLLSGRIKPSDAKGLIAFFDDADN
ncbi:MAG: acyl-CoA thioesterase [Saprospiraceae bacterium]|nr:acyl-CoA thioesterase [Bacteroidia bacterium]NNE14968.1 acyl-CoA thioesterase [Saprospiraceae bacterium]NNL92194.1 acyl-CoA thioesterase [Saprospiraceae bacterium]